MNNPDHKPKKRSLESRVKASKKRYPEIWEHEQELFLGLVSIEHPRIPEVFKKYGINRRYLPDAMCEHFFENFNEVSANILGQLEDYC